MTVQKIRST